MKSKLIFILIFFTLPFSTLFGQQVISSGGTNFKGTSVELSWTIGEPVIETYSNSNTILTQGFHQSDFKVTAIDEISLPGYELAVYPNPVSQKLNLEIRKGDLENLSYDLFNTKGKLMQRSLFFELPGQVNMESYSSGTYLLKISDNKGNPLQSFKIIKK